MTPDDLSDDAYVRIGTMRSRLIATLGKICMWNAKCQLSLCGVLLCAAACAQTKVAQQSESSTPVVAIKFTVSVRNVGSPKAEVILQNQADGQIDVPQANLPWITSYNLILTAVETTAEGYLARPLMPRSPGPISDPPPGSITLGPHKDIRGEIDLERALPGITTALTRNEVVLFWNYLPYFNNHYYPRQGGWVLLKPRN
jgi:hypothetical protein